LRLASFEFLGRISVLQSIETAEQRIGPSLAVEADELDSDARLFDWKVRRVDIRSRFVLLGRTVEFQDPASMNFRHGWL